MKMNKIDDPIENFEEDIKLIKNENILFKNEFKRLLKQKEPEEWIQEIEMKKKPKRGLISNLFGFFSKR
jgi:hypothetical protein